MKSQASEVRYCKDIDMFAIDRPMESCMWRTSFCKANCYNGKLYPIYKDMVTKDKRNEPYWQNLTGSQLSAELNRKHKQTKRFRFMTRGEAINCLDDIEKIVDICAVNADRLFWLPTRSWRSKALRPIIEAKLLPIANLRLQASLDPSNTQAEIDSLVNAGWSTMFFGNDDKPAVPNSVKCAKTWEHALGHCSKCTNGCFSSKQKHVWLKKH